MHENTIDFYAFVLPEDQMGQLVSVAASGRVREVGLLGTPLKWRKGTVSRMSVTTEIEIEESQEIKAEADNR